MKVSRSATPGMRRSIWGVLLIQAIILPVFISGSAGAAVNGGDMQIIQRQQEQILQQQEERLRLQEEEFRRRMGEPPASVQPETLPHVDEQDGAPCLEVKTIAVSGATLLGGRGLRKITGRYENQCLGLAGINNLLRDITNAYIEKGHVTSRAFVDTGQTDDGVLKILVIEGTIEKIIINDGEKDKYYQGRAAFPFLVGKPLNLRDIEQGLDQLNRLPSNNATLELEPGAELGGTVVRVHAPALRSWRGQAQLDNLGQRGTGKTQYSLSFEKDNYIGLGDQTAVYWSSDLPFWESSFRPGREIGHSSSLSAYFSLPFGYWTLYANASASRYKSTIFGDYARYGTNGDTHAGSVQLERVIHRDGRSKTSLAAGLNFRDTNSYIEDLYLESGSYSLAAFEAALSHNRRLLGGVGSFRLTYARGMPWFGAGPDNLSGQGSPRSRFDKYSATVSWYRPINVGSRRFYWNMLAHGQISPQTLYGSERLSLGGRASVRGFHDETVSGDTGFYVRNELGWNLPWFKSLEQGNTLYGLQFYAAYDCGVLSKDRHDPYERGVLLGVAAGLRSQGDLSIDVAISKAAGAPDFLHERGSEIYASMSYKF